MNIQHLKYAVEVEKTGSITQAAENLYMGQPNLSKAIKELENSVGITIFIRTPKGIATTEKGKIFLTYAKNVLVQINEMESMYKADDPDRQQLSIAVPRSSYITRAFVDFSQSLDIDKDMAIDFKETNSINCINLVAEGRYDLGVIRYQIEHESQFLKLIQEKGLRSSPVYEFEYLVLMHSSHPLANVPEISFDALSEYIEILHGDMNIPLSPNELDIPSGRSIKRHIFVYERGSQFDLLRYNPYTYMWSSPAPLDLLESFNLVQRACYVPNNTYKDVLIFDQHHRLSAIEQNFIQHLAAVRDQIKSVK